MLEFTHLEFLLVQNIIACIFCRGKNVGQNSSNYILRYGYLSRVSTGPEHQHPTIIPVLFNVICGSEELFNTPSVK